MKKFLLIIGLIAFSITAISQVDSYSTISNYINTNIKSNGSNAITGAKLNQALTYIYPNMGLRDYDATANYYDGKSGVIYNDKIYICNTDVSGEAWNVTKWTKIIDFTDTLNLSSRIDSIINVVENLDSTWLKVTVDTLEINGYNQKAAIQDTTITITHDSLLVLYTRPQILISNPGASKMIIPLDIYALNNYDTDTLDNTGQGFAITYETATNYIATFDSTFTEAPSVNYSKALFKNSFDNMKLNEGLYLETQESSNPTNGGGDFIFYITYIIR